MGQGRGYHSEKYVIMADSPYLCLTEAEARARLEKEGVNELPSAKPRSASYILLEVVREPMLLLLILCGAIYLVLGEKSDAIMLLSFVFIIMGITFYQEHKTERAIEALRDLSSPRALVIRDGKQRRIPGREVVRGDLICIAEGDRVPADAVLLETTFLTVDESLLTGESLPVRKAPGDPGAGMGKPGGDHQPWLFSGTLVVKGKGIAEVLATGAATEMGKIGRALQSITQESTPLSRQTGVLVRNFALAGVVICTLVVILYGLSRGSWLNGILAGLTLAMALIPEEFPVVLSIFLALGAWRIAQRNVLTRRVPAVETLGAATVLCVDKTGTLTQNRMSIRKIVVGDKVYEAAPGTARQFPEAFHRIIEYGVLASQADPFDPMDKAFVEFCDSHLAGTEHVHHNWELQREYPLSDKLLAMSHVWKAPDSEARVVGSKGAPEAIADLCHLDAATGARVTEQVEALAQEGLRVLAVAEAEFDLGPLPPIQHDLDFRLLGLVGFVDPLRETVAAAVAECHGAGVHVAMITGDYPSTARQIAQQAGLRPADMVITGPELDTMTDEELAARVPGSAIFARVVPEQKLRIVNAYKRNGAIVAMTGDGVNDAPALKAADIGVAMGGRGTDVAREASDLVLLDDDFSSIVHAIRLGRRIFDNLRKAIAYIMAVHVPIAGLSLLPILIGWPLILLPVHIVFLEMVIDPSCSVVFEVEPEEPNVMRRAPRKRSESLLSRHTLTWTMLQGLGVLAVVFGLFGLARYRGYSEADARTIAFAALLVSNLALIAANRSWSLGLFAALRKHNSALWWIMGGALTVLALVIYVPPLQALFHFAPLHPRDLALAFGAVGIIAAWMGLLNQFRLRPPAS